MASEESFVIVGASLAGAKAAETLRAEGFQGRVVLIGEEAVRPYERPPLSKEYLRGEKGFDDAAVHTGGFYQHEDIDLRLSTQVSGVDLDRRDVTLASGERIGFDRLLLATGSAPRRLEISGAGLPGVHYLRTVVDSDALRQVITPSAAVVVIGAGWIGSEVTASARQLGAQVSMVDMAASPLESALGPEVGAIYRRLHGEHGVDMHFGVGVEALVGSSSVEGVRLSDGSLLDAQVVVVGIGARPRTELAQAAGLQVDNGVLVDEHLATSSPGVYACGDLANAFHPYYGRRIRLEHWSAALNQGPTAARNMMGDPEVYQRTPYFYSDQYDLGMEYRGLATGSDRVVFRGEPEAGQFIAFWLRAGHVVAAMNANVWDAGDALEALVRLDRPVDPDRLVDAGADLGELVRPLPA